MGTSHLPSVYLVFRRATTEPFAAYSNLDLTSRRANGNPVRRRKAVLFLVASSAFWTAPRNLSKLVRSQARLELLTAANSTFSEDNSFIEHSSLKSSFVINA